MTQILVSVPDQEAQAFLDLLIARGYEHQLSEDAVPEWQQELVLSRIANAKPEDYSDLDEVLARLRNRNA